MNSFVDKLGKIIWNYLVLDQPLKKSDCILVFGGYDLRAAVYAAKLYHDNWAKTIIVSGGRTQTANFFSETIDRTETEMIENILLKNHVPKEAVILETKAKNTSENFGLTADLMKEKNLNFHTFILIQKPYAKRRTYLTGLSRWPGRSLIISSIDTTYEEYTKGAVPKEKILDMLVGEITRMKKYPQLGYFEEQPIPAAVLIAYEKLSELGYNKNLIKEM